MGINFNKKIEEINYFLNKQYFPLLKAYGISEEEMKVILQNIVNKVDSMKDKLDELDTEDYDSLIDLATNGGIVYKDENGTQFEDINEALINSTIGSMAAICKKNGVPMEDYSLGNPNVLPTEAEEKISKLDTEDFKMFFKGDSLGFYNRHGKGQKITSKDELEKVKQKLLESIEDKEDLSDTVEKEKTINQSSMSPQFQSDYAEFGKYSNEEYEKMRRAIIEATNPTEEPQQPTFKINL